MQEKVYLSIKGERKPLYEYCRQYKVSCSYVLKQSRDTGMPVSKIFCDLVNKKGHDLQRKDISVETKFDYDEYVKDFERHKKVLKAKQTEDATKIRQMYKSGMSMSDISKELGLTFGQVRWLLEKSHDTDRTLYNVTYFMPYGSSSGEWKTERGVGIFRLAQIRTFGRGVVATAQ